jgi:hypothetical protein
MDSYQVAEVTDELVDQAATLCSAMASTRSISLRERLKHWPPPTSLDLMRDLEITSEARQLASAAFDVAMRARGPLPPVERDTWHTSCYAWGEAESMLRDGWLPGMEP